MIRRKAAAELYAKSIDVKIYQLEPPISALLNALADEDEQVRQDSALALVAIAALRSKKTSGGLRRLYLFLERASEQF
ncbi:MAG TPA: hypothetical protein VGK31_09020 [Thermoanaerobaculia bacterium]|jgi:hypothetical protein